MESRKRRVWVFVVAAAVVGLVGCCGLAAIGAVAVPVVGGLDLSGVKWYWTWEEPAAQELTERVEQSFQVGSAPALKIVSVAGSATIRAGADDTIRVVATKVAKGARTLRAIDVKMSQQGDTVEIRTSQPLTREGDSNWVRLEITVPSDTRIDVTQVAGDVQVTGVQGALRVDEGAGGIEVRGASGPVRLRVGAGGIIYEGRPEGESRFQSTAGGISLFIQRDAGVTVDLGAVLGDVRSQLPVRGTVQRRAVRGAVGSGGPASLTARTGVGEIDLRWQ